MKKKTSVLISVACISVLASCSLDNPFGSFVSSTSSSKVSNTPVTSLDLTNATDPYTKGGDYFRKEHEYAGMLSSPSTGDVKMLVIPINMGSSAAKKYTDSNDEGTKLKTDLNTAFFGTSDSTNYWESVSSYYKKSSYEKLNITGSVSNYVNISESAAQLESHYSDCSDASNAILEIAVKSLIDGGLNYSDYDSDGDGSMDLVWLVYTDNYSSSSSDNGLLWAYTYWDYWSNQTKANQATYGHAINYSWSSAQFMYEGTSTGVDAHTFIHESGHQMGLDDYYSYDDSPRSPLGETDMMDYNIVDHNSFSKYCLDWITPTIGEAGKTYTLKPFESSGDALIIASSFNGTCFDEFFICEYYTPTGLNELDSTYKYANGKVKGITQRGLRILHADQRLGHFEYSSKLNKYVWDKKYYNNPDVTSVSTSDYFGIVSSNSKKYCNDSEEYTLLSLVQASGNKNLLSDSSIALKYATNNDIFTNTSSKFGKDVYSDFTANEGWSLDYNIEITSMNDEGITFTLNSNSTSQDPSSSSAA